jgi:hypothetical protein
MEMALDVVAYSGTSIHLNRGPERSEYRNQIPWKAGAFRCPRPDGGSESTHRCNGFEVLGRSHGGSQETPCE